MSDLAGLQPARLRFKDIGSLVYQAVCPLGTYEVYQDLDGWYCNTTGRCRVSGDPTPTKRAAIAAAQQSYGGLIRECLEPVAAPKARRKKK